MAEDPNNLKSFTNKSVSIKLSDKNYFIWCQQVELTVRGQGLDGLLDGPDTAQPFITDANGVKSTNPA